MDTNQIDLTLHRETLVDKIVEIIEKRIVSGQLSPKTKLSETIVAKEFGVSRVPAREALQRLEEMGFIRKTHLGREVIQFSIDEFREVYELKNVVEAYGVMKGAYNATEWDIKEIHAVLREMENHLDPLNLERIRILNAKFHDHLVHCSGNSKLIDVYELRVKQLRWANSLSLNFPNRPRLAVKEHREIFEAFKHKDGEKARLLMEKHTNGAMGRILSRLAENKK